MGRDIEEEEEEDALLGGEPGGKAALSFSFSFKPCKRTAPGGFRLGEEPRIISLALAGPTGENGVSSVPLLGVTNPLYTG